MRTTRMLGAMVVAGLAWAAGGCASTTPHSTVVVETVTYGEGDAVLEGALAWSPDFEGPRPGVVVVHEWWGLGEHAKEVAADLAREGFVAFALDMYGQGKLTDDPGQASQWAGQFRGNGVAAGRARAKAGLDVLRSHARVDVSRLGAIGFCFGGTVSLEMAWSTPDLDAAVCIHGHPTVPGAGDRAKPGASVLVLHGNADPFVPATTLQTFRDAMDAAGADWEMDIYGTAVHSFTSPAADARGIAGAKHDPVAARRAMARTVEFLKERLGAGSPAR